MVYCRLHPVSPGTERMLASIAHMTSISGGVKVNDESLDFADFMIRPYPKES
jgi:hypothetical protein